MHLKTYIIISMMRHEPYCKNSLLWIMEVTDPNFRNIWESEVKIPPLIYLGDLLDKTSVY